VPSEISGGCGCRQLPELPIFFSIEKYNSGIIWVIHKTTSKFHLKYVKEEVMIEITITETAKIELFKVLRYFDAQSIRLIQQGFG